MTPGPILLKPYKIVEIDDSAGFSEIYCENAIDSLDWLYITLAMCLELLRSPAAILCRERVIAK